MEMSNLLNTENNNLSVVPTANDMLLQLLSEVSKLGKLTEQTFKPLKKSKINLLLALILLLTTRKSD
jgi:hypothetical protein